MERLRKCTIKEAKQVFSLIRQRMRWMDKKGFDSWNQNHYDEIFPLSYFEKEAMLGRLFALVSEKDEHIISAAVLLESDSRWDSEKPVCSPGFCPKQFFIGELLHQFRICSCRHLPGRRVSRRLATKRDSLSK